MKSSLLPNRVCAFTLLIRPFLSLLNEISSTDKLDSKGVAMLLRVPNGRDQILRLSNEIALIGPAEKDLLSENFAGMVFFNKNYKMSGPLQHVGSPCKYDGRLNFSDRSKV